MPGELPDGPRMPPLVQTLGWVTRPTAFAEQCRRRHGSRFTLRLLGAGPLVVIADPQEIREILLAPADVLHPGEGGKVIEPLVGPSSVIVLDEDRHLEQRRLMSPPFHGEALRRQRAMIDELCEREVASWPLARPIELHSRLQQLTLQIILRVVFGLDQGSQLDELSGALIAILASGSSPLADIWSHPAMAWAGIGPRMLSEHERADRLIGELVEQRRREGAGGSDVLSLLLAARHEDGTPMSDGELRDELVTTLAAGHETTASQLAWAFAILARAPAVADRLSEQMRGGEGDELLTATIQEVMRMRPVLPTAEPRRVNRPAQIGAWLYPPGTTLIASTYLLHHDPTIYPDPYSFRPERFLRQPPGTYTWIPYGGGRRRCIGASFAMLEMQSVIRAALTRFTVAPAGERREVVRRRAISITPSRGATVLLCARGGRAADRRPSRESSSAAA